MHLANNWAELLFESPEGSDEFLLKVKWQLIIYEVIGVPVFQLFVKFEIGFVQKLEVILMIIINLPLIFA
jgi:hypothetical protein